MQLQQRQLGVREERGLLRKERWLLRKERWLLRKERWLLRKERRRKVPGMVRLKRM